MSWVRTSSSPNLAPSSVDVGQGPAPAELTFEAISAEIKLLLKLIQDHQCAITKDQDGRRSQRVSGMITILDDLKSKIQKAQSAGGRRTLAKLRRCQSDLRPPSSPTGNALDEKEKLRRELHANLAARKSLEAMCSSLSKENGIIASELAKKVHQLNSLEEHIEDLRAQNDFLLAKLQACAVENRDRKASAEPQGDLVVLQERSKALSEQLLKSLDGYRSLRRKYKDTREENKLLLATMEEMEAEVAAALQRLQGFRAGAAADHVSALQHMLEDFNINISKHLQNKDDYVKL